MSIKCLFGHKALVYRHSIPPKVVPIIECEKCQSLWEGSGQPWTGNMGIGFKRGEKALSEKTVKQLLDDYNYQKQIDNKDYVALINTARNATPQFAVLMDKEFARSVRALAKMPENEAVKEFVSECLSDKKSYECMEFSALVFIYACEEYLDILGNIINESANAPFLQECLPVFFYMSFPKIGTPHSNSIILNHLDSFYGNSRSLGHDRALEFTLNAALEFHNNYECLGGIVIEIAKKMKKENVWFFGGRNKFVTNLINVIDKALGGSKYFDLLENT